MPKLNQQQLNAWQGYQGLGALAAAPGGQLQLQSQQAVQQMHGLRSLPSQQAQMLQGQQLQNAIAQQPQAQGWTTVYTQCGTQISVTSTPVTWSVSPTITGSTGTITCNWDTTPLHSRDMLEVLDGVLTPAGRALVVAMPDGSKIHIDVDGNYRVEDTDAKVTYKASRVLEFNPYVNASDLLVRFIAYLGSIGLTRTDVPTLPIALFVNWLILEAAQRDDTPAPADVVPPAQHRLLRARVRPRCLMCHRFVRRLCAAQGFSYCNPDHAARHFARLAAA